MTDQLIKALAFDGQVRLFVLDATKAINEAQKRHQTWHTASAVLGRTLIATGLLAANLKGQDRLSVQIKGTGPVGQVVAEGNGKGQVRGYVSNPQVALELNAKGKLDVAGAVGLPGILQVTKYIDQGQPFSGQVALISGELGEDFTYYMATSEQTPSAIGLSVLVNPDESIASAGGFMVQVMPGASEETISLLEKNIQSIHSLSDLIDQTQDLNQMIQALVGTSYKLVDQFPVSFVCPCSKASFGRSLQGLDKEMMTQLIEEDHGAEVVCHYCNNKYQFSEAELRILRDEAPHSQE